MTYSYDDQIKCVKRELAMRKRVYAKQVSNDTLTQSTADWEIGAMEAVLETVEKASGRLL